MGLLWTEGTFHIILCLKKPPNKYRHCENIRDGKEIRSVLVLSEQRAITWHSSNKPRQVLQTFLLRSLCHKSFFRALRIFPQCVLKFAGLTHLHILPAVLMPAANPGSSGHVGPRLSLPVADESWEVASAPDTPMAAGRRERGWIVGCHGPGHLPVVAAPLS